MPPSSDDASNAAVGQNVVGAEGKQIIDKADFA